MEDHLKEEFGINQALKEITIFFEDISITFIVKRIVV